MNAKYYHFHCSFCHEITPHKLAITAYEGAANKSISRYDCTYCTSQTFKETEMDEEKIITEARITPMPQNFGDPMPQVFVKLKGERDEHFLFEYYPDEISFRSDEFIGLTVKEARHLKFKKDKDYLQS